MASTKMHGKAVSVFNIQYKQRIGPLSFFGHVDRLPSGSQAVLRPAVGFSS